MNWDCWGITYILNENGLRTISHKVFKTKIQALKYAATIDESRKPRVIVLRHLNFEMADDA